MGARGALAALRTAIVQRCVWSGGAHSFSAGVRGVDVDPIRIGREIASPRTRFVDMAQDSPRDGAARACRCVEATRPTARVAWRYDRADGLDDEDRSDEAMSATSSRERTASASEHDMELGKSSSMDAAPATESSHARLLDGSQAAAAASQFLHSAGHANSGAIAAVLSYCVASISMTVINKYTVSGEKFTMNLLVLLCQCVVGVVMVYVAKRFGLIQIRELNKRDVKTWFPISTMLVFVIYTGSKALQHMDIPIYTIFKNLTIILIAYGELLWFNGRITPMVFMSFVLMVLSSVIAAWPDISRPATKTLYSRAIESLAMYTGVPHPTSGWGNGIPVPQSHHPSVTSTRPHMYHAPDVSLAESMAKQAAAAAAAAPPSNSWSTNGYVWMLANCLISATYVLIMRKRIKVTGFKDWDTMFYNNLLSIPVLLVMSLLVENWSAKTFEHNFPAEKRSTLIFAILLSGTGGVFISYTTAWCIRVTSSTTYSMVGALNKLPLALSGILFFGNAVTPYNSTGIAVGFIAGIVYAVGKNKQAEAARLANTAATGSTLHAAPSGGHKSDLKGEMPLHTRSQS